MSNKKIYRTDQVPCKITDLYFEDDQPNLCLGSGIALDRYTRTERETCPSLLAQLTLLAIITCEANFSL